MTEKARHRCWLAWWLVAPVVACVAAAIAWRLRGAPPPAAPPAAPPLGIDVGAGIPGVKQPLEVGPGPAWRACQQRFHGELSINFARGARVHTAAGPEPGWWAPDEMERQMADGWGVDLLLVPGLTVAWECSDATRCKDALRGRRGDALLAVPRRWAGGGGGGGAGAAAADPAARRRTLFVHGGRFDFLSPFSFGFPLMAAELAALTGGPVLVHDYPLAPAGSWRDALGGTLAAARWLLAWDGRIGGDVCRPGDCSAAAQRALQAPEGAEAAAPSFEQLLRRRAASPGAFPLLLATGDSSGGNLMLQLLLALTQRRYAPPGSASLVAAALAFGPYTEPLHCLGPSYITSMWCVDRERGVVVGDPDYTAHTFSSGWGELRMHLRGFLRGNGSDGSGAVPPLDVVDWAVVNPLWAPPAMLRELPPLSIQVGTSDKFMAEDLEFAQRAAAAGARAVQVDLYDGMWHAFQVMGPGCGGGPLEAAEVSLRRGAAFLRGASGDPGAWPPWPERLGWPRVEYFARWPDEEQRAAVAQSMYDP
eukprot:scaffold7.g3622.t1